MRLIFSPTMKKESGARAPKVIKHEKIKSVFRLVSFLTTSRPINTIRIMKPIEEAVVMIMI